MYLMLQTLEMEDEATDVAVKVRRLTFKEVLPQFSGSVSEPFSC